MSLEIKSNYLKDDSTENMIFGIIIIVIIYAIYYITSTSNTQASDNQMLDTQAPDTQVLDTQAPIVQTPEVDTSGRTKLFQTGTAISNVPGTIYTQTAYQGDATNMNVGQWYQFASRNNGQISYQMNSIQFNAPYKVYVYADMASIGDGRKGPFILPIVTNITNIQQALFASPSVTESMHMYFNGKDLWTQLNNASFQIKVDN